MTVALVGSPVKGINKGVIKMAHSEKLREFIEANRPEKVVFSVKEMITSANICGIKAKIGEKHDDKVLILRNEGNKKARIGDEDITVHSEIYIKIISETIIIEWRNNLNENRTGIVYQPKFGRYAGGSYLGELEDPEKILLPFIGLDKKEVGLPEQVMQLPVPSWVELEMLEEDWSNASIASTLLFKTEAKEMAKKFRDELETLIDEDE